MRTFPLGTSLPTKALYCGEEGKKKVAKRGRRSEEKEMKDGMEVREEKGGEEGYKVKREEEGRRGRRGTGMGIGGTES